MSIVSTMTATIRASDVQRIIADQLSGANHITVTPADVSFNVGEGVEGYGFSERSVTSMSGATVTTKSMSTLLLFGDVGVTTTMSLTTDQVREAIARHFATKTGRPVKASDVRLTFGVTYPSQHSRAIPCLETVVVALGETEVG